MANVNRPCGLRPLMRNFGGGAVQAFEYSKLVGYTKAIRKHDAVTLLATGYLGVAADITPGTTLYLGVALNYAAASTASNHQIINAPDALFEAQDNDASTGLLLADRGLNANLLLTDGGTPLAETSGNVIDYSTRQTTATLDVKLLELLQDPTNAFGPYSRWVIKFNKHQLANATAGI